MRNAILRNHLRPLNKLHRHITRSINFKSLHTTIRTALFRNEVKILSCRNANSKSILTVKVQRRLRELYIAIGCRSIIFNVEYCFLQSIKGHIYSSSEERSERRLQLESTKSSRNKWTKTLYQDYLHCITNFCATAFNIF